MEDVGEVAVEAFLKRVENAPDKKQKNAMSSFNALVDKCVELKECPKQNNGSCGKTLSSLRDGGIIGDKLEKSAIEIVKAKLAAFPNAKKYMLESIERGAKKRDEKKRKRDPT